MSEVPLYKASLHGNPSSGKGVRFDPPQILGKGPAVGRTSLQGYLAHKKTPTP